VISLEGLASGLAGGTTSAAQLVDQAVALARDPAGEGARTFLAIDEEGAKAYARHIDGLRKRSRVPSPWAGIPVAVKDLFDLAGEVTTAGSVVLKDGPAAAADAPAIARLKSAGLIVIGRTNMTEFAYSGVGLNPHYGTPAAPYERGVKRIPGGSSSGAGVAVADGVVALAIGTDTAGSCRIPAAFCGVVGFKPSAGRISTRGAYPLSTTLDSIGPLASTVASAAVGDALMAGDWNGSIIARPAVSLRLGILRDLVFDGIEPPVAKAVENAISRMSKAGIALSDITFPLIRGLPEINARGGITAVEAFAHHKAQIETAGERYDPRVRKRILAGAAISGAEYLGIVRSRTEWIAAFEKLMAGYDGLVLPTVAIIPPPMTAFESDEDYARLNFLCLRNTFVASFLNGNAISLPVHEPGAAPVGLMIMTPWGRDQNLFSIAATLEPLLRELC
jgi:aspartyl-tRNA(Asn)/glutamyl-tRNA(Gln) amidotransferase subunit A